MPWTKANPPAVAKNWTDAEKEKCVKAANAVLADGGSDESAIYACISAAGKGKTAEAGALLNLRLAPATPAAWRPIGPADEMRMADGSTQPHRRYLKDVIRTGTYVKATEGIQFHVTDATLANFTMQFAKMKANGVKVPIPAVHRGPKWEQAAREGDPRDNMGWVDELFVENGTLWMVCSLIGDEAISAAAKADVSLNCPPTLVDGHGNVYQRPITHVAMVVDPVVPGLGEFIPLAASQRITLQQEQGMLEFLQKIGAMLGVAPESLADEATAMQAVSDAIQALIEKVGGGEDTPAPPAAAPPGATPPAPTASAASPATPSGVVTKETVSREFRASQPSPMLVQTIAENRGMKIDRLVESGHIIPPVAAALKKQWIGADGEVIAASLQSDDDGKAFDAMLDAFKQNGPVVKQGSQTGPQVTKLSLADPTKGSTDTQTDNPLTRGMDKLNEEFQKQRKAAR